MTSREIRRSFLQFFEQNGHRVVPSSSLVPLDDPTLLFTNAGMNQFKDVFLGKERREYVRAASSQKCMRVSGKHNDLDNVGPSLHHHTFFEMLGNFSFGDYFKKDAIAYAWSLLTDVWKLPADRLHATTFGGEGNIPRDEEAHRHWLRFVPADRITELGLADNFWAMGETGPCGRCSEIHYFRGADPPCPEPVCQGVACSCDRFVEIWNNVFMEFERQPGGTLTPLPAPSIDTGMGLERITAVLQDKLSNYDTDLFRPLILALADLTDLTYGAGQAYDLPDSSNRSHLFPVDVSMRVVADHIRATTFLIADGVVPSNEWRGYVLRKIMRRAMRHGRHLGMREPFLHRLVKTVVREMGEAYPELRRNQDTIIKVVRSEEERFDAVLNAGLLRIEDLLKRAAAGNRVVPGEEVFRLYDTYGVPVDFVEDLANERRVTIDREGFDRSMEAQREKARATSAFDAKKTQEFQFASEEARRALQTMLDQFEGYTTTCVAGVPIVALFDEERRQTRELRANQDGYVLVERTPFYLEAGGQVSDTGRIFSETGSGEARVEAMARLGPGGSWVHKVRIVAGSLKERDLVTAEVDAELRDATRRNHTATHLLHATLRAVLGTHVKQAGSLVAPDRLRFDFVHFAPLTRDQLDEIERLVNEQIYKNTPVQTEIRATQEAIAAGAMALFGEKYGERVRVVTVPGFSVELCGGTHCRATGDIGFFTIAQETGIAAGVRRIEALTGAGAVRRYQERRAALDRLLEALNAPEDQAVEAVQRLQSEVKRLSREKKDSAVRRALDSLDAVARGETPVASKSVTRRALEGLDRRVSSRGRVKVDAHRVEGLDREGLRKLADSLKKRLKSGVVVLATETNDQKVAIVVAVTTDLRSRVHAGQIVKELAVMVGGAGGGRPDFAEAGGKDPSRIDEMLARSYEVVSAMVGRQP